MCVRREFATHGKIGRTVRFLLRTLTVMQGSPMNNQVHRCHGSCELRDAKYPRVEKLRKHSAALMIYRKLTS